MKDQKPNVGLKDFAKAMLAIAGFAIMVCLVIVFWIVVLRWAIG